MEGKQKPSHNGSWGVYVGRKVTCLPWASGGASVFLGNYFWFFTGTLQSFGWSSNSGVDNDGTFGRN